MTRTELIAALRRGDASPDMQRRTAELLEPKKRGPKPKPDDVKRAEARELIDRVDALAAKLGSLAAAYRAMATAERKKSKTIERQHDAAKSVVEEAWVVSIFNEFISEG